MQITNSPPRLIVTKVDQLDYRKITIHSKKLVVKYNITMKRNKQHASKSAN